MNGPIFVVFGILFFCFNLYSVYVWIFDLLFGVLFSIEYFDGVHIIYRLTFNAYLHLTRLL